MCQEEEYQPRRRPHVSCVQKCIKCKEASPMLVIRVGNAFCKACFREYFVHKFHAMLGKKNAIYPGEKVLLALLGGPASSSMLQQVQDGLSRERAKKLHFMLRIIYVDGNPATCPAPNPFCACSFGPAYSQDPLESADAVQH